MDGEYVLNRGGRQVDGGIVSLEVLAEIVEAVGDKVEIIFDSGIRNGADIMKALALGAKMVFTGQPLLYGLALHGREGLRHVLWTILGELGLTLHLTGMGSATRSELKD